jgi:hypothetical protein
MTDRKEQDRYAILNFLCCAYSSGHMDSYTLKTLLGQLDQFIYEGYIDDKKTE